MKRIQQQTLDQERALYGMKDIEVVDCAFDGPADGESALKEGAGIKVERCYFNLRYPFWHDHGLVIRDSRMTELCRAALWYSDHIEITHTALHGIKALRECSEVTMRDCDIISPEFGWSVHGITMEHCTAQSEYFMMRSTDLHFTDVTFKGKYSFQYIENATFEKLPLRYQGRVLACQERGGAKQRGQGRVSGVVLRERNLRPLYDHRHPAPVLLQGSAPDRL